MEHHDLLQLLAMLVVGVGAFGLKGVFFTFILGALLALGANLIFNWHWISIFKASLLVIYILPFFIILSLKNFGFLIFSLIFIGSPFFFLLYLYLNMYWYWAVGYGLLISFVVPFAIIRTLLLCKVISENIVCKKESSIDDKVHITSGAPSMPSSSSSCVRESSIYPLGRGPFDFLK